MTTSGSGRSNDGANAGVEVFIDLRLDLGAIGGASPTTSPTPATVAPAPVAPSPAGTSPANAEHHEHFDRHVDELEVSVRTANSFQNANIRYLGELVAQTAEQLLDSKHFGRMSLTEINEILAELNLTLGMNTGTWKPPT